MDKSALSFFRMAYEDRVLRLVVTATNGQFAGELEVFIDAEKLGEFSRLLNAFPSGPDDEARLELGSRDGTLGNEMRRLAPTLRDRGVAVTFGKNRNSRLITITRENGFESYGATRQHVEAPGLIAGRPPLPKNPAPHVSP
jgi:hypothetical protein